MLLRFYLKSLPPPTPSQLELKRAGKISLEQEYVNLCTRTKTYGLQQVQSSNSIILVRPEKDNRKPTGEEGEDDARLGTEDTVTVIAQCWSTLELKDYEGGVSAAVSFLEKCLPVHRLPDVEEDDMDLDDDPTTSAAATGMVDEKSVKDAVLRDVPLSPEECERGWIDICAFVDTDEMKAWRPSAKAKLEVWMKILEGSVIQGIELDKQFLVNDLWKAVSDYDGEEPSFGKELFEAVVKRLLDQEASRPWETELKCMYIQTLPCGAQILTTLYCTGANFDKDTTVRWAAETYLEATAPTPETAMSRTEFLNKWKDNLPEIWRDQPSWANFKVCFTLNLSVEDNIYMSLYSA